LRVLPREFYERKTEAVARGLLGKLLVRRGVEGETGGVIVETEAYLGEGDPASRASRGKTRRNEIMWGRGGLAFIDMVHGRWLLNITTERPGRAGAVLVRAIEPTVGVEMMMRRRGTDRITELASGPGKLTEAMGITRELHGTDLTDPSGPLVVLDEGRKVGVARSHRIGVGEDLPEPLRFFVPGSPFVSRARGNL